MNKRNLWGKFGLILAVCGVAAFFAFPPEDRIALGLDLKGGAHVLMQVDTGSALKYRLDITQSRIGQALKEEGLAYQAIVPAGATALEVQGTNPSQRDAVAELLAEQVGEWEIDRTGEGTWRLSMSPDLAAFFETSAVDTTLAIIRDRVEGLGVSETLVQKQGIEGDRILVQLPGVEDPERVKAILEDPAILEWKAVSYPPGAPGEWTAPTSREEVLIAFGGALPPDTELYREDVQTPGGEITLWWPLKRVSVVMGNDLRDARRSTDEWGEPTVAFELSQDAGRRFEAATTEYVGRRMAIVLGPSDPEQKRVLSAPTIRSTIRDQGVIEGGFDVTGAEDLALKLRSGALPTDISVIEERTVGPSLGRDSIRAGLISGLAGFVGVMLFMLVYYRLSGLNAVVALALNVLLVFGTLGALPFLFAGSSPLRATLTLPGIAGLILTVGMAVDSNVLIFERIREELRLGKTVRAAVDQGFSKAFMTILDCNVTTVVAAIFLAMYGTGPVRGFAVTLVIGLLASMFTAVFVSRQLFELVLLARPRAESLSI